MTFCLYGRAANRMTLKCNFVSVYYGRALWSKISLVRLQTTCCGILVHKCSLNKRLLNRPPNTNVCRNLQLNYKCARNMPAPCRMIHVHPPIHHKPRSYVIPSDHVRSGHMFDTYCVQKANSQTYAGLHHFNTTIF
jgi:hypothetical protein